MPRRLPREEYTVGWVCALAAELAAAKVMLDEEHEVTSDDNNNIYCMGTIAGHNIVIGCLPAGRIGNNAATAVATQMQAAFKGIRFGLMVGIGGGVPSSKEVNVQRANELLSRSTMLDHVSTIERIPTFQRRKAGPDVLFDAGYNHQPGPTCDQCSVDRQRSRPQRESGAEVVVHYGTIASGNLVIKDATERDRVSAELDGVLCFEMEAAGLMDTFPCLVIRGICDYADSHKNSQWQSHAAGTAAAYAKQLLTVIPAADVMRTRRVDDAMRSGTKRTCELSYRESASSKRGKTDPFGSTEDAISETASALYVGDVDASSNDRNRHQAVTLPFHEHKRGQPSINEEQKRNFLGSLRSTQMDARQMTIKTAHAKTCRWLLESSQYLDWLDASKLSEHHGFLWIKGKAGAGKSTIMKFATLNARKTMGKCAVLSFFFNARGADIERSTIGTYRSLLLQLLEAVPESQSILNSPDIPASALSADPQWSLALLKTLFEQALQSLKQSSVVCFIDALDECEEKQIREMIQLLEHIAGMAVSDGFCFKVCFSSRHYPHITIQNGVELVLEGQEGHAQDIADFVESELKIGKSKTAQEIRNELQEKASGVFMWVVLVVDILNTEFDHGHVHALRRKLQKIPDDLHELFRDILTRDSHNKESLVLCIQWVLFAKQPLGLKQLYHALLSSIDPDAVSEWDPEDVTKDDMKKYILNSSKGLTEVTTAKDPKIQFIHESVRDFLLKENGLGKIWPEFVRDFQGQSHERLKRCCHEYIDLAAVSSLKMPRNFAKAFEPQIADLRKSTTQTFPFLEYAVQNVLYHADTSEGSGISQVEFLDRFPVPRWVQFANLFQKYRLRRHTRDVSLLYLLAEFDMANLVKVLDSASQCMDVEGERYGCPLFAAAAMSSEKPLAWFMHSIKRQLCVKRSAAAMDPQWDQVTLAQNTARRDFVYLRSKDFLLNAAELGHDEILDLLVRSEQFWIDVEDSKDRTPLWWASKNGCEMAAKSLISAGSAKLNSKDKEHKSPLYVAAEQGNKAIIRALLDSGAEVNAQGESYGTALQAASFNSYKEVAMSFRDKSANFNAQGTPVVSYKEIVELLLERGANVNAQGGFYGNSLQAAAITGHKEIVKLLLEKGANVNAQGGEYGNALQAASDGGYKEIVELLLEKGADVNAQGGKHGSALQAATNNSHTGILELLQKEIALRT